MQTRIGSATETATNIILGFGMSMLINGVLLPSMGFHVTAAQNLEIVAIFTVVSVIRSYSLRRFFNWLAVRFKF